MNTKLLIDAIVHQTTVLIAQLSTASGIRAPLAHVADRVFLELASEIEAQGVGRKVVADMFGLALRSYQKKVQRLTESASVRSRTLWEAVLDFLAENGSVTRERMFERFRNDPEQSVAAVLSDLASEGLIYATGKGLGTVYGLSSEADRARVAQSGREESVRALVWHALYRAPANVEELSQTLGVSEASIETAVQALVSEGRVRQVNGSYRAETFLVPVGAELGWEAAVFDHFSAMARAVAAKLRRGAPRSGEADVVGGATLTFEIEPGHPHAQEVLETLSRVRREVNELWARVEAANQVSPLREKDRQRVTFYFGQNVEDGEEEVREEAT
jgi:Mn-dependent DtxR family transcriptional regulator